MDQIYSKLDNIYVSRETFNDFEKFILLVLEKNKEINIIGQETEQNIRERHIIDSAQTFEFIDLKSKSCADLGTGAGMPGIVLAIIAKHLGHELYFNLYEKSYHKSKFLKKVAEKLDLKINIIQEDVFKNQFSENGTIIARAFKPLSIVLELVNKNFKNSKNLILFMGKSGQKVLKESFTKWNFDYEVRKSLTNEDSFILNIKNIKKK